MKKDNNILKKIFKMTFNIVFYAFILVLLVFSIVNLSAKKEDDIPNMFNKGFVTVLSDSMNGKDQTSSVPSFKKDALVFVKTLNEEDKKNLKIGDVIVFYGQLDLNDPSKKAFIIHRVVYIDNDLIYTQGDKVNSQKPFELGKNDNLQYEINNIKDVKALATSKIEGIGGNINYLRTPKGFGLWILLPLFILIIIEVVILVKRIVTKNKQELKEKHELEKELLKQEILKELQSKNKE